MSSLVEIIMRDRVTVWVDTGYDPAANQFISLEAIGAAKVRAIRELSPLGLEPHGGPEILRITENQVQLGWRIRRAS